MANSGSTKVMTTMSATKKNLDESSLTFSTTPSRLAWQKNGQSGSLPTPIPTLANGRAILMSSDKSTIRRATLMSLYDGTTQMLCYHELEASIPLLPRPTNLTPKSPGFGLAVDPTKNPALAIHCRQRISPSPPGSSPPSADCSLNSRRRKSRAARSTPCFIAPVTIAVSLPTSCTWIRPSGGANANTPP